jgi:hypothetical protein
MIVCTKSKPHAKTPRREGIKSFAALRFQNLRPLRNLRMVFSVLFAGIRVIRGLRIFVDSGPKHQGRSDDCPRIEEDERESKNKRRRDQKFYALRFQFSVFSSAPFAGIRVIRGLRICVDSGPKHQGRSADCPRIEEHERELKKSGEGIRSFTLSDFSSRSFLPLHSRGFASFAGSESVLIADPSTRGEAPIARTPKISREDAKTPRVGGSFSIQFSGFQICG